MPAARSVNPAADPTGSASHLNTVSRCHGHPLLVDAQDLGTGTRQLRGRELNGTSWISLALQTDEEAWLAYPRGRAFYDRLWLAQQLGYLCGPAGTNPPYTGWFFVKPVRNLLGLGIGAARTWYAKGTHFGVPPGSFWSECFEGEHLSIDYRWNRRQCRWTRLCSVSGVFSGMTPLCWIMQPRGRALPQLPSLFGRIAGTCDASRINVEFIGGRVIECHLRSGLGDWRGSPARATRAVPIWKGMPVPENMVPNEDDGAGLARLQRIGFVYE